MSQKLVLVKPSPGDVYELEYWAGNPNIPWMKNQGKLLVWYSVKNKHYTSCSEVNVKDVSPIVVIDSFIYNDTVYVDCKGNDGVLYLLKLKSRYMKRETSQMRLDQAKLCGNCRMVLISESIDCNNVRECMDLWGKNCCDSWVAGEM